MVDLTATPQNGTDFDVFVFLLLASAGGSNPADLSNPSHTVYVNVHFKLVGVSKDNKCPTVSMPRRNRALLDQNEFVKQKTKE